MYRAFTGPVHRQPVMASVECPRAACIKPLSRLRGKTRTCYRPGPGAGGPFTQVLPKNPLESLLTPPDRYEPPRPGSAGQRPLPARPGDGVPGQVDHGGDDEA